MYTTRVYTARWPPLAAFELTEASHKLRLVIIALPEAPLSSPAPPSPGPIAFVASVALSYSRIVGFFSYCERVVLAFVTDCSPLPDTDRGWPAFTASSSRASFAHSSVRRRRQVNTTLDCTWCIRGILLGGLLYFTVLSLLASCVLSRPRKALAQC